MTELELRDIINLVLDEKEGFSQIIEQKDEEIERLKVERIVSKLDISSYYTDCYKDNFNKLYNSKANLKEYGRLYLSKTKIAKDVLNLYEDCEKDGVSFDSVVNHVGALAKKVFEEHTLKEILLEKGKEEENA